ncbi:hypothetical protein FYL10_08690 [Lactobacillus salivarius]|uniref:Uncharacterized protein n=1 Tax=Ligilactobacillus salivarius TaxID=1624 RepID=A0ABD6J990_9LACO|nr:hypothetical protein [Ligilactobacillus salivarius]MYU84688.1 hypothetical protein [Ligilactobacillus salivarius]MYU92036.1 hypothetical protein [Ligilactobacillus salivarius]MYV11770.1 hypothetical protein [Ligilactobacillus salivarius]MYY21779.1 hypothetical protein [Ligilactobacillus salivarius]
MHSLLGYSWAEIASILAVISVLFSGIYWLFRHGAKVLNNAINIGTYPLQQQFKELTNTIKRLNKNFEEEHEKLQRLEQEVEEHDKAITLHEEKIKRLEETK